LRYGSRFRLSRLRQIGLPRPTLDRLLVKRAIYKVNSFQFTRLTRLGLAHQDLQDYQDNFILASLYPVHPGNPVKKKGLYFIEFLL
jgi:hypothetical protein